MNKYETLTKPYKLFDKQIDELNKVEKRPFDKMIEIVTELITQRIHILVS